MEENSSAGAPVLRGSPRPEGQSFAGKSTLPDVQCFTAVFGCNLAKYGPNPFHADTPFGRPISIGLGDYLKASDDDHALIEKLLEALKLMKGAALYLCASRANKKLIPNADAQFAAALDAARAAIAEAEGHPQ